MHSFFKGLSAKDTVLFRRLNDPKKIQSFVEAIPFNFEKKADTLRSPLSVLRKKEAHCLEGALLSAAVFSYHGEKPILLDLKVASPDDHHAVALFKRKGKWGAISKTNHAVLRYRDPVYSSPRELAMSYFHEYFLENGRKTLRSYAVFDLGKLKKNWIADEKDIWYVERALDRTKHIPIIQEKEAHILRKAEPIERMVWKSSVWKNRKN
jgi:hypothetical protein